MNYYLEQIGKIKEAFYSNIGQLETVIGTRHYIDNHFEKELNLDLLSSVRFTSKFHLLRLYKKYYGVTPKQFIIDKRIEAAKKKLANGKNIVDTCYEVGFECPSSFSTIFKTKVGLSPSAFQKRAIFTKSEQ